MELNEMDKELKGIQKKFEKYAEKPDVLRNNSIKPENLMRFKSLTKKGITVEDNEGSFFNLEDPEDFYIKVIEPKRILKRVSIEYDKFIKLSNKNIAEIMEKIVYNLNYHSLEVIKNLSFYRPNNRTLFELNQDNKVEIRLVGWTY